MAGGQEITSGQGSLANSGTIRLRSKKSGTGTASLALTGQAITASQGAFTRVTARPLTGSAITSARGTVTPQSVQDATWPATVPDINFAQGAAGTYDLLQHTANFNSSLHDIALASGTLPSGITLPTSGLLTYDGSGAVASAAGVSFIIRDRVGTADSDFLARKTAPGVIRSFDFDTLAQLGGSFGSNFGTVPGVNGTPTIDTTVKASGGGALKFNVLAGSGSNANWFANFSSDLSKLYGGNSQFYIQWKQRISQTVYEDWGHKYILIGSGDDGSNVFSSCTDLEIEMEHYSNSTGVSAPAQFPIMYNACPGSCGGVFVFYENFGGSDFKLQNGMPSPFCRYQDATKAGCHHVVPDQWMVFQVGVELGARITQGGHFWFSNTRVRAWMQQSPTSPETLIIDWQTGITPGSQVGLCAGHGATGNQRYGKVWLLPYTQNNVSSPRAGNVWYDELIIGEQKIPAAQA